MTDSAPTRVRIREAVDADVPGILDLFRQEYSADYPQAESFDDGWLKRSIFGDDVLLLVAEDVESRQAVATASAVFDAGPHSDLMGEFGRLAVRPEYRRMGVGSALMDRLVPFMTGRLHVGVFVNREVHSYSEYVAGKHGFSLVGLLPMRHLFRSREHMALYARHSDRAVELRRGQPRVAPECLPLAEFALESCGLARDVTADEAALAYPADRDFAIETMTDDVMPALLRIERGELQQRDILCPMRRHQGFFQLRSPPATYLVARETGSGASTRPVTAAIGYQHDVADRSVRIVELISREDRATRFLIEELVARLSGSGEVDYVEIDVNAHSPRMQRTLLDTGFLPAAYVPAMALQGAQRVDGVRMCRLLVAPQLDDLERGDATHRIVTQVKRTFARNAVLPQIAASVRALDLCAGLSDEQTARLARAFQVARPAAGDALLSAGEQPFQLTLVVEGGAHARAADGTETSVTGGTHDADIGTAAFLTQSPAREDVTAGDDLLCATLSAESLGALCTQRADIGLTLYRNLAKRLQSDPRGGR